ADHLVVALSLFWNAAGAVRTAGGPGRSAGFRRGRADRELMTTAAVVVPPPASFAGAPRALARSRRIVRSPRPGPWGPPSRRGRAGPSAGHGMQPSVAQASPGR